MKYVLSKIFVLVSTLILISLAVFFVFQILPGDPAIIILGIDADPSQLKALSESLGLDLPLHQRYLQWVTNALRGDFGMSLRYPFPVMELIMQRLPITAMLTFISVAMSVVFGLFFGIIISKYADSAFGKLLSAFTQIGLAIPTFWLGLMLSLFFGIILSLFPANGFVPFEESFWGGIKSLFLPALALSVGNSAVIVRFLKNTIMEQMNEDYVRAAKSRGLTENKLLFRHVLRNALIPVITIVGIIVADTLSGSIIIENVFSIPGLGQLIVSSISNRDLPLIQALSLYIAFIVVMINFIVDFIYRLVDPRISNEPR